MLGTGRRVLGSFLLVGLVATGAYAFTASNTVPASKAGDGTGAVSGYVLSSVHYGLNGTDPTKVDSLTFTLNSTPVAGSTIKAKLASTWYDCTNSAANVTCDTTVGTQATVQPVTSLQVVVAD
jgi:hypothetical protein